MTVPQYLNLAELDRHQLENLLLTIHSAFRDTLAAVREHAQVGWKVRREVEKIAERTSGTSTLQLAKIAFVAQAESRVRVDLNRQRWESWNAPSGR